MNVAEAYTSFCDRGGDGDGAGGAQPDRDHWRLVAPCRPSGVSGVSVISLGGKYLSDEILDTNTSGLHDVHVEAGASAHRKKAIMSATLTVRHTVADYAEWRAAYDSVDALRSTHGCTAEQVFRAPGNPDDVFATHHFPSVEQASAFPADPALAAAMQRGGVASEPQIKIFERV